MKQLDKFSKWFDGIIKHPITQTALGIGYVFIFLTMALYLISVTFNFEANMLKDGRSMYWVLLGLFILPLALKELFREGEGLTVWGRRTFNWMYWGTIVLTGLGGAAWYLVPNNPRLEPATMLLGFALAAITFSRKQQGQEKTTPSA